MTGAAVCVTRGPVWSRRAALFALALSPFVVHAATAGTRKRLVLVGAEGMFDGPNGLDEVVAALRKRGVAQGPQLEVLRVVIEPPREDAKVRGLDHLVPKMRSEVLSLKPDVIVTVGSVMTKGAHLATRSIPIVTSVGDPVDLGVAESLARPGGNVTGVAAGIAETSAKLMEFARVLVPRISRVAIFYARMPVSTRLAGIYERAAKGAGLEPVMIAAMEPGAFVAALQTLPAKGVQAGIWTLGESDRTMIVRKAIAVRLPLIGLQENDAEDGCLVSYYAADAPWPPRMAELVEQILRGADPATIPFQFPREFRLVINRRTANALKLVVPPELLLRADRVID